MNLRICELLVIVALVSGFLASATTHASPPLYTITDLGTLGGSISDGAGINARGEITGTSTIDVGDNFDHAFLYNGTSMKDLGTLGGDISIGNGINNSGWVTGWSYLTSSSNRNMAFIYNGTTMSPIGTLAGAIVSVGNGINNSGWVTGYSGFFDNGLIHTFLYDGTTMKDLGTLGGSSTGTAINDRGEVAGYFCTTLMPFGNCPSNHAFLYDGTTMKDLGTLVSGTFSQAFGINNNGDVVGLSVLSNNFTHAFLYDGTTMKDIGTLGGNEAEAFGINNRGDVVGWADISNGTQHPFLYQNGTMFDLANLIVPTDPLFGTPFTAEGINDSGQIVARGCYTSGPLFGQCHAFRLDPVLMFAGTPGKANCHGKSVSALARQYGGLNNAAAALGFDSVGALQKAIDEFCEA